MSTNFSWVFMLALGQTPKWPGPTHMTWALNAYPVVVCLAYANTEMGADFLCCFVFLDLCLDIALVYEIARVEREKREVRQQDKRRHKAV